MSGVYTERRGSGPPLVLLPGMAAHHGLWGREFVAAAAERFELLLIDHRGTGASVGRATRFTVADLATDAAEAIAAAELERPVVLGHSMGGMVALDLALSGTVEIGGLVLLATSAGGPDPVLDPAGLRLIDEAMAANDPARAVEASWEANVSAAAAADPRRRSEWGAALGASRVHLPTVAAQRSAVEAFDARGRLADLGGTPVLVVHGAEDRIIASREATALATAIPNARLERLDGAGHLLTWERPHAVVELTLETVA